jgi:hypothetical protein
MVVGAETYDVDFSHSGRCIAEKGGESKGGSGIALRPFFQALSVKGDGLSCQYCLIVLGFTIR